MRDPINRAYSHWNHINEKSPSWGGAYNGTPFVDVVKVAGNNLVTRSKYLANLTKWVTAIGSDKIYVALQESIESDPLTGYNNICDFLGVSNFLSTQEFKKIFALNYSDVISEEAINYLKPVFADDVAGVQDLYPHLDYSLWNDYS